MTKATTERLIIPPPNFQTIAIQVEGTAPLVIHKFSAKAAAIMKARQVDPTKRSQKTREPKDFDALYNGAMRISDEGWHGISAPSFRNSMIAACRLVGFKMTIAKLSVFVEADGFDKDDGAPLVKITKGKPVPHEASVRLATGVADIRVRPMWRKWECKLRITFDADQFKAEDVLNLLSRAGQQCGVGEGRPNSKASNGQGWGTFKIKEGK